MASPIIIHRTPRPAALLPVLEFGRQRVTHMVADRRLPVFAAVLVERGQGVLQTEAAGTIHLEGPCLFWLLPDALHSYGPLPDATWDERWVLFGGPLAHDFVATGLVRGDRPAVSLVERREAETLMNAIQSRLAIRTPLGDAAASALLHQLVTCDSVQNAGWDRGDDTDAASMVRELRDRAFRPVDFGAFARDHGVSPATLRRRFTASVGMPPKSYQISLRMDRAKALLVTGELPVADIAGAVGFEDSFYFARLFAQREGCSPSTFRRRHRRH